MPPTRPTRWQQRAGTYLKTQFAFDAGLIGPYMTPTKIILHRQGNPGVEGQSGIAWMNSSGWGSIHRYIDDTLCAEGVPLNRRAYHANAIQADGQRADVSAIGIETEDESPQSATLAPGQPYGLSQDTRITLLLVVVDILKQYPGLPIYEHADFDPKNRPDDLGDALNLPDFRLDVADVQAGREPWRTVGPFATGSRAPADWQPAPIVAPRTYEQGFADGRISGHAEARAALNGLS